jgi:hypothetical protein
LAITHPREVHYGAAVYGSFLVAAVVGAAFDAGASATEMMASALGSMLVFWLAHAWSEVIGERIAAGGEFRPREVFVIARGEWPLVQAAVVPTVLLALASAGVWSRETGAVLALVAAILQITGWGFIAGLRSGGSWRSAGVAGVGQGMLGVVLLLLERLVH